MVSITWRLITPGVPNFVFVDDGTVGKRQDGLVERPKVDVANLTDDQLRQVGVEWTESLIAHAKARRAQQSADGGRD